MQQVTTRDKDRKGTVKTTTTVYLWLVDITLEKLEEKFSNWRQNLIKPRRCIKSEIKENKLGLFVYSTI